MPIKDEKLTPNFSLHEFIYPKLAGDEIKSYVDEDYGSEIFLNIIRIAERLQVIRDYFGKPLIINSGFRPVNWEKKKGRSGASQHSFGLAVDFYVKDIPLEEVYDFIQKTFKIGGRAINKTDNFIHLDARGNFAIWTY